jgi:hypothetical protein
MRFTALMCYLGSQGLIVLYPELTFASLTSVHPGALDDASNSAEVQYNTFVKKGFSPLRIRNLMVVTTQLRPMTRNARCTPEGEMVWKVNWKPKPDVI